MGCVAPRYVGFSNRGDSHFAGIYLPVWCDARAPAHYNPPMRRAFFVFLLVLLAACAPAALPTPLFFYLRMGSVPTLVLTQNPESATSFKEIPLQTPPGCAFWELSPAPAGPYLAVAWECAFGPSVQLLDLRSGAIRFLVTEAQVDNRLLAWEPHGTALYLKVGTLTDPQVLRFNVAGGAPQTIPLPPNTYDLSVSLDNNILYSVTNGIGFGSETRLMGHEEPSFLADPKNILGLFRYALDGQHIAYIRLPDGQEEFPAGELWIIDADGQNAHLVASADAGRGMPPVWSPDGEKIAFIGQQPDGNQSTNLSIYSVNTATLATLAFAPVNPPVWFTNGLYFTLAENDTMSIWFYDTANTQTRKVLGGACCAGWIH
jgi:hypothetical protein